MKLSFTNGPRKGESVVLQPPGVCIGRESDNDIQLLVAGVSRYHAKISFDGVKWSIADLGSTNGTKVNGVKITGETPLKSGDQILLGDQTLLFGEAAPEAGAKAKENENSVAEPQTAAFSTTPSEVPVQASGTQTPEKTISEKTISEKTAPEKTVPNVFVVAAGGSRASAEKKSEQEPPKDPKTVFAKVAGGNIFGKKESAQKHESGNSSGDAENKPKHLRFFFPVLVISLAVIVICFFVRINFLSKESSSSKTAVRTAKPEFVIEYERQKVEPDNVFRFAFTLENGSAKFVLDDLKFGRRFEKKFENVNQKYLKDLEDSVRETEFLKLKQEPLAALATDKTDERRKLTVLIDNKQNSITVRNAYAQSSFEAIERAIDRFADSNGISSVAMNVEEMRKYAFETFRKAEDLFNNYEAKPENLREAISRYNLAMEFFEQFVPRPREWDIARKRSAEAKEIYNRKMKDIEFNIQRYYKLKQWANASAECQKGMDMVQQDSKAYQNLKKYKLTFDRQMRK